MKFGFKKGYKPQFIKQMAMLMSICYLMSPLQHEISSGLHGFFHSLDMPSFILSHTDHNQNSIEVHPQHDHENQSDVHEHPFIDLVATVFEAAKENQESDNTPLSKTELKKHITSDAVAVPIGYSKMVTHEYFIHKIKLRIGHFNPIETPPKTGLQ